MIIQAVIDQVLSLAFPRRFAPSLLPLKRHLIYSCLTEIQQSIPSFCVDNVDVIPGTFDLMTSGASIVDAPDGEISQVLVGGSDCQTIPATLISHLQMQRMQQSFADAFNCGSTEIKPLYPTSKAYWSRDRDAIAVYPWVPDGWNIGVRWNGVKRSWASTYDIWWADKAIETLRLHAIAYDDEKCPEFPRLYSLYKAELCKLKFEQFRIQNPTQYDPYATDVIWPAKCSTSNDTGSTAAIAS